MARSSSRRSRRRRQRLSSTLLVLVLLVLGVSAVAAPSTLWEAIRSNNSFTVLADCVRLADDPALMVRVCEACDLIVPHQTINESIQQIR